MRYGCTSASVHSHCLRKFVCGSNCLLWSHHAPVTPAVLDALYPAFVPGHNGYAQTHTMGFYGSRWIVWRQSKRTRHRSIKKTTAAKSHFIVQRHAIIIEPCGRPSNSQLSPGYQPTFFKRCIKERWRFWWLSHLRAHRIAGRESGKTTLLAESSVYIRRR